MVTKKITSLQHPIISHWLKLRKERPYREKVHRALIMGEKMVRELPILTLISTKPTDIEANEKYLVTEAILKKITSLSTSDGFAAEVALPPPCDVRQKKLLLILDNLADPGNLGTLLRTALALNWDAVIVTDKTVDLFNDKALRAGKGAQFHLPFARMTPQEITKLKTTFYIADLHGTSLEKIHFQKPLALILSNEATGPNAWAQKIGAKVTIEMNKNSESLNVASSGAILLYAMRPR